MTEVKEIKPINLDVFGQHPSGSNWIDKVDDLLGDRYHFNPNIYKLANGDLKIELNKSDREAIRICWEYRDKFDYWHYDYIWERLLFESGFFPLNKCVEYGLIGALTDSVIISEGMMGHIDYYWGEGSEDLSLEELENKPNEIETWWYPNYMVVEPLEKLIEEGFVIFDKG